ncbi:DUF2125 domain-containing protein [Paracoccus sp. SSK6]|uniref:DUF2125 domain-containing protein n=1 Tax=Paracoccus sp. SSK6 TaxID=3143131 RepID=UPI00321C08F8
MFRSAATSVLALTLGAAPVLADVTPAEVWENLQKTYAGYGYQVTGKAEDAGGTLTVTDAVFTATAENGGTTITIPRLTFQETGDAKVRIVIDSDVALESRFTVPAPSDADEDAPAEGTEPSTQPDPAQPETVEATMTGTLKAPGNETLVSGTPEDMLYEYSYPSLAFDIAMPADPAQGTTLPLSGTLSDVTGTQRSVTGDGTRTTFDVKASEATMQVAGTMPEGNDGPGSVNIQARMTGLSSTGSVKTPAEAVDPGADMAKALAAGFDLQTTLAFEAMNVSFDVAGKDENGQDQTGKGTVQNGATDVAIQMSAQGIGYKGNVADTRVEVTVSSLPFPVSYGADRTGFDLLIPVSKADAAQPFRFAYALEGLTFADGIWDLFDPNKQLSRDPASLAIDLSGDAMVTRDLFDPAMAEADAAAPTDAPFTPKTLTINKIALDAVGAKADISGALDFGDNPNEPVGTLNGTFEGVNGLMDKLVAMGLVPQEQMMGMRMMLAMFAKPDAGNPDRLTSEIEFREGGSIFANGQQVK